MKLDDRRKVIEALLCAASEVNNLSLLDACGGPGHLFLNAAEVSRDTYQRWSVGSLRVSERYVLSAYRLIESSPTLRREWFGR